MKIYIAKNGQQTGPFTIEQVRASIANATVSLSDLAWHEALSGWVPLSGIPELQLSTPPPVPATASTPPVPIPAPVPGKPLGTPQNPPASKPQSNEHSAFLESPTWQTPPDSQPVARPPSRISSSVDREREMEKQNDAAAPLKANGFDVASFICSLFGILVVWVEWR